MNLKFFLNRNKIKKVKLILLDVDGVLTDGGIYYNNSGMELKRFNVMDGSGIKMAVHTGIKFAIITGRKSKIVNKRAKELSINKVYQGVLKKHLELKKIMKDFKVKSEEIAYITDDIIDLKLLKLVGVKVAVKNACRDIKRAADFITPHYGGHGAVRDFIEYLLKVKKLWKKAIQRYS